MLGQPWLPRGSPDQNSPRAAEGSVCVDKAEETRWATSRVMYTLVRVRVYMCVHVCVCVCLLVRDGVCACVRVFVCVFLRERVCVFERGGSC